MSSFKVVSLLIRTISKPIANSIKSQAKDHQRFRKICIGIAQTGHRMEMNLKMRFLGYHKEHIRPLNDKKAVEAGANFLSEAILFSVAGTIILFENFRSRTAARDRRSLVNDTLAKLEVDNHQLMQSLQRYQELNHDLESRVNELQQDVTTIRDVLNRHLEKDIARLHQEATKSAQNHTRQAE
ncbi:hypothetical protein H4R34_004568 [Dimargaris verticillata]|uniref:Optic atrophy 3 protein-domain-containing protein n=1 Tax=Dimargaris verticillata TaxID=2761393 RepID=A0A9W8EB11_9FUNG|nr:hypothetical protein H4R34_004568 [Dimargaris verticillata]